MTVERHLNCLEANACGFGEKIAYSILSCGYFQRIMWWLCCNLKICQRLIYEVDACTQKQQLQNTRILNKPIAMACNTCTNRRVSVPKLIERWQHWICLSWIVCCVIWAGILIKMNVTFNTWPLHFRCMTLDTSFLRLSLLLGCWVDLFYKKCCWKCTLMKYYINLFFLM